MKLTSDTLPPRSLSPFDSGTANGRQAPTRLLLVDDDDLFRGTLESNLTDEGFAVECCTNGAETLSFFESGGDADVLLLDWKMPGMDGLEVLRQLRRRGVSVPVIFLSGLSDDVYEEAALNQGAVDFTCKGRRLSVLLKRINLILTGARSKPSTPPTPEGVVQVGDLSLRPATGRASWRGCELPLTLTEFNILLLLTKDAGKDVPYRDIYDLVHGDGFFAGEGEEGYRTNVRTFIKRIRSKFRNIDEDFDNIENYAGFGYRWLMTRPDKQDLPRPRGLEGA